MKYCKNCGSSITDVDDICPSCGSKQSLDVSVSFQPSSNPTPVWPLVLSIIFIVISLVAAVFSLTIILSIIVLPLAIISLIFSIISVVGASKNEKRCGRNGVLTSAKVIGSISLILSIISVFTGTFVLCATIFGPNMRNYQTSRTTPSYSYSIPTTQSNQNPTNTEEDKIEPLSLVASKIKIFKYNMAVTENSQLLCWNWYNYRGNKMMSTNASSDSIPYGIGIIGKIDKEYLYISEISFDTWGNEIILTETITLKPNGEILYISPCYILYEKNNKLNLISYEKETGSVLFDQPISFILNEGKEPISLEDLHFNRVYREYTAGQYTYDNYNPASAGLIKYRLSFISNNGNTYYGTLQNGNYGEGRITQQDNCVEIYVRSEITDNHSKKPQLYIMYEEGTLSENIDTTLQGHIRDKDRTHLYVSSLKDDLKINLPEGYTIDDISGISISNDSEVNVSEWSIPEIEKIIICMKDNSLYYNTCAASVKGVDLEPYTETNKALKEKDIVRVVRMSHIWHAIDKDGNLYEVNLIK